MTSLTSFSKFVPSHILHQYSKEMKQKSEVCVLDVLNKNEACYVDMLEIMIALQGYLGEDFPSNRKNL